MKSILKFNLPEDEENFRMAINGQKAYFVLWEVDQWLRAQTKYAPDTMSEDMYKAYEECRDQLHRLLNENDIDLG